MSINISNKDGILIVSPETRLDTTSAPEAEALIIAALEEGDLKVIMDFSGTEYISSAGLRIILKTAKLLKPKSGTIVLCNANEQINEVLEISGFSTMVSVYKSQEEAFTALNS